MSGMITQTAEYLGSFEGPTAHFLESAKELYYPQNRDDRDHFLPRVACISMVATSIFESAFHLGMSGLIAIGLAGRMTIRTGLITASLVSDAVWNVFFANLWSLSPSVWLRRIVTNVMLLLRSPKVLFQNFFVWQGIWLDHLQFTRWLAAQSRRIDSELKDYFNSAEVSAHLGKSLRLLRFCMTTSWAGLLSPAIVIKSGKQLKLGYTPSRSLWNRVVRLTENSASSVQEMALDTLQFAARHKVKVFGLGLAAYLIYDFYSCKKSQSQVCHDAIPYVKALPGRAGDVLSDVLGGTVIRFYKFIIPEGYDPVVMNDMMKTQTEKNQASAKSHEELSETVRYLSETVRLLSNTLKGVGQMTPQGDK